MKKKNLIMLYLFVSVIAVTSTFVPLRSMAIASDQGNLPPATEFPDKGNPNLDTRLNMLDLFQWPGIPASPAASLNTLCSLFRNSSLPSVYDGSTHSIS